MESSQISGAEVRLHRVRVKRKVLLQRQGLRRPSLEIRNRQGLYPPMLGVRIQPDGPEKAKEG